MHLTDPIAVIVPRELASVMVHRRMPSIATAQRVVPVPLVRVHHRRAVGRGDEGAVDLEARDVLDVRLAVIGVGIGLVAAFGLARLLTSLLFQTKTWDPVSFALVPVLLIAVAVIAVWLPAQRAIRVNPVDALRYE